MKNFDEEAELAVIGSCLIDRDAIHSSRQFVSPLQFYSTPNQRCFEAALRLHDKGTVVDVVTLAEEMERTKMPLPADADGGWLKYLVNAINSTQHAAHAADYSKIVARYFYDRELSRVAGLMSKDQDPKHIEELTAIVLARRNLDSLPTFDYKTGLHDFLDDLTNPAKETSRPFGLKSLDAITDGIKPGELITFGAATNQGKSLMLLNLADLQARAGMPCLFVGTEMRASETVGRHLAIRSGIASWKIRLKRLDSEEIIKATETISGDLCNLPINILDLPSPSIQEIESSIARTGAKSVFIDYLDRLELPKAENLRLQIKEAMRCLKNIARRYDAVVFLASQLNRKVYSTVEKLPPTLADLSESSAIEKESDRVFLLWRPKDDDNEIINNLKYHDNPDRGLIVQIIKCKDRHGPNHLTAELKFDPQTLLLREVKNKKNENESIPDRTYA